MSDIDRAARLDGIGQANSAAVGRGPFAKVLEVARSMPGALAAIMGLAFVLVSDRSMRITTLVGIYPVELSLVVRHGIACLVFAALCLWVSKTRRARPFDAPGFYLACSLGLAISIAAKYSGSLFGASVEPVVYAGKVLEEGFSCALLFCWGSRIFSQGVRGMALVALSLAVTPLIQFVLSFLQRVPCMVALAVLPLASFALFAVYFRCASAESAASDATPLQEGGRARQSWATVALYAGIVSCLSFVIGNVIYESLGIQDARSESPVLQLCIIGGNCVGAVLAVAFCPRLKSHSYFVAFLMSGFASCAIALYLAGYFVDAAVGGYLFMSSLSLQVMVMLVWFSPFLLGRADAPLRCFAFMYAVVVLAKMASAACMVLSAQVFPQLFSVATSVALLALFACCSVLLFRLVQAAPERATASPEGAAGVAVSESAGQQPAVEGRQRAYFKEAVDLIASEANLTRQETRVFSMLARGMNATAIAEELVVSTNTAKSHMRNAYAKLGVHSQQEIVTLVRTRKARLKDE